LKNFPLFLSNLEGTHTVLPAADVDDIVVADAVIEVEYS
jgi:hypothetical protein